MIQKYQQGSVQAYWANRTSHYWAIDPLGQFNPTIAAHHPLCVSKQHSDTNWDSPLCVWMVRPTKMPQKSDVSLASRWGGRTQSRRLFSDVMKSFPWRPGLCAPGSRSKLAVLDSSGSGWG